ncbi:MAG: tRNA pseudouridine(38-40) synthase TruA [Verrucomicrobia bacterium]|nr:tRNA pseudouridine(38-40) synthase TruA [Verrucomicrobiota bacterium]
MNPLKFKLTIAYDGTAYQGWQVQKIGTGVQEKVEAALGKLFPSVKRIHSSSRTDTGVHALGMVAHVEIPRTELRMPARRLAISLNAFLPEDIRVLAAVRCPAKFHARFDATGKQYRYCVWNHHAMNPLLLGRAWHFPVKLDLAKMRAAAKLFLGRHDFKSFAGTRDYEMASTVRTLSRCDIRRSGPEFTFIIEGDGFLYKMCRGIVGTLVQVGQGKIPMAEVEKILAHRNRAAAGMTAPAHGLVLWKVFYNAKGKGQKAKN